MVVELAVTVLLLEQLQLHLRYHLYHSQETIQLLVLVDLSSYLEVLTADAQ